MSFVSAASPDHMPCRWPAYNKDGAERTRRVHASDGSSDAVGSRSLRLRGPLLRRVEIPLPRGKSHARSEASISRCSPAPLTKAKELSLDNHSIAETVVSPIDWTTTLCGARQTPQARDERPESYHDIPRPIRHSISRPV